MTDLTPEKLAEWRKDTNRDRRSVIPMNVWLGRIIALLNALAEQQRIRVEITRTLVNPANCKVWRDGVLVFDGVSLDALAAEKERANTIPRYAMLDVWVALRGSGQSQAFEPFRDEHGYAETWARLMHDVRAEKAAREEAEQDARDAIRHQIKAEQNLTLEKHETSLVREARGEAMAEVEHYKARVAALEAGINALIDMHDQRGKRINPNDLRDLTGKGADS